MCKDAKLGQGCPLFLESKMVASSVTGVGQGDSNGKQKPELHSGCGCCSQAQNQTIPKPTKKGCSISYSNKINKLIYKINSNTTGSKSCF